MRPHTSLRNSSWLVLAAFLALGLGCTRVRLAQRVGIVKSNYDQGNFARVLGYSHQGEFPKNNNVYDPPGNFTVHEVRSLIVKGAGQANYNYDDLFDPGLAAKLSVQGQEYLRQLALIELRSLVHQYFSTHRAPYQDSSKDALIQRAHFLIAKLGRVDFPAAWERTEMLACQGDLAVLDGQYEVAQAAYSTIFANAKDVPEEILAQYAKRYIQSFERAASTDTVSLDAPQKAALEKDFGGILEDIADLIPEHSVGIYAGALAQAQSRKPLQSFISAMLAWRRSDDLELHNLLDQFVQFKLEDYWPLMKNDPRFHKLILDQWNANKGKGD